MYAPYVTSYQYGAQGKKEVLEMVSQHIKEGNIVLTTPELTYDLRDKKVSQISWEVWKSPKTICKAINEMEPEAIIIGLTTHTFQQLRWIFYDPSIQSLLKQYYLKYKQGTFFVWLRK
jgi:aromatic ring-opening dioxygenase catalytic subunit (LigB family)